MSELPSPDLELSGGVHAQLDVETIEMSAERVVLSVPVGPKVHQPFGILHGGVSALIAESAASMGGMMNVPEGKVKVGTPVLVPPSSPRG